MGKHMWKIKQFSNLTAMELYEILALRVNVFVVEQDCPYPELDGRDTLPGTLHLWTSAGEIPVGAYLRILAPGVSYPGVSLGRVVTAKSSRGGGLGHELVEKAIGLAEKHWPGIPIQIGAQEYLKAFYESHGFSVISDTYLEDNIPHIDMVLNLT